MVADPHHLPRWWPRVERVEDVEGDAFTKVMKTAKGKTVRADFKLIETDERRHVLSWAQQVADTPFQRVLESAETEIRLVPDSGDPGATEVTIELRQTLASSNVSSAVGKQAGLGRYFRGFGNRMVHRAANATLGEALDGLDRISGRV